MRGVDYSHVAIFMNAILKREEELEVQHLNALYAMIKAGKDEGMPCAKYESYLKSDRDKPMSEIVMLEKLMLCRLIVFPIIEQVVSKDFKALIPLIKEDRKEDIEPLLFLLAGVVLKDSWQGLQYSGIGLIEEQDRNLLVELFKEIERLNGKKGFTVTGRHYKALIKTIETLSRIFLGCSILPKEDLDEVSKSNC